MAQQVTVPADAIPRGAGAPAAGTSRRTVLRAAGIAATAKRLALQHMNQITERIDRDVALGRAAVFGPRLQALVAGGGGSGRQVLSAFRLGHPVRDGRCTPRRPVSEVTR